MMSWLKNFAIPRFLMDAQRWSTTGLSILVIKLVTAAASPLPIAKARATELALSQSCNVQKPCVQSTELLELCVSAPCPSTLEDDHLSQKVKAVGPTPSLRLDHRSASDQITTDLIFPASVRVHQSPDITESAKGGVHSAKGDLHTSHV